MTYTVTLKNWKTGHVFYVRKGVTQAELDALETYEHAHGNPSNDLIAEAEVAQ